MPNRWRGYKENTFNFNFLKNGFRHVSWARFEREIRDQCTSARFIWIDQLSGTHVRVKLLQNAFETSLTILDYKLKPWLYTLQSITYPFLLFTPSPGRSQFWVRTIYHTWNTIFAATTILFSLVLKHRKSVRFWNVIQFYTHLQLMWSSQSWAILFWLVILFGLVLSLKLQILS